MADGYIQVPLDSAGKKVSTVEVTRADGTVVEYQDVHARALVTEAPQSFVDGEVQPMSLTSQGRLRVSSVQSDVEKVWQNTNDDPWGGLSNSWGGKLGDLYV